MSKYTCISKLILTIGFVALTSCKDTKKSDEKVEVIPEDIVEIRADQQKLAHIETGAIEFRSLSGTLKVNGTVSVAPQNI